MRYLVTGGAGFLGSHLCDKLIAEGHYVICVDNYLTSSSKNIEHLAKNYRFEFLCADATSFKLDEKIDGIFHLASPTAPAQYNRNPEMTLEVNTSGTLNLLELARKYQIPMLYVSSIRVIENISNCYINGKRNGESACIEYVDSYGVNAKIARLGNVYGPRMAWDDSRVIPTFIRKIHEENSLTIFGDGEQLDSFCYVDDIIEGICMMFFGKQCPTLMEFGGEPISIKNLAEKIIEICDNKNTRIEFKTDYEASSAQIANPEKAIEILGWKPKVSLYDGLLKTIISLTK